MMLLMFLCVAVGLVASSGKGTNRPHEQPQPNDQPNDFLVHVGPSGNYAVSVNGKIWLKSAPTFFTVQNKEYSVRDGSLKLIHSGKETGSDVFGAWDMSVFYYQPQGTKVELKVSIKQYRLLPLVLFGQHFLTPASGCSVGNRDAVSSGFPSFYVGTGASNPDLGYLAYGGIMSGDTHKSIGRWTNKSVDTIKSGLDSGPLVLFDKADRAIVVSSFANFMAGSVQYTVRDGAATASWGLLGSADSVYKDFDYWTALMYSSDGINKLMEQWGDVMMTYYNKDRAYTESDLVNNYIGYWTDNGAYYYYLPEGKMNYEETMIAVKKYADKSEIPYRYVQYDSWFYPKGSNRGVTDWNSTATIFPDGLKFIWEKTGWPVVAHNRWWSNDNVYAKQNGGQYNFYVENKTNKAIPLEQKLWDDLMINATEWGLITYEQDWLNVEFDEMDVTVESLSLGQEWLYQMGQGALKHGVTIQYCMSPSRHLLTSLQLPVVTQSRVSNDYQPGEDNWKIGVSSMFAYAVGVAPFKDNFWTTSTQPGNVYNKTEPHSRLHSLTATLSTGPVGPSDKIGFSDRDLILKSCNADGLILKPSRPATALDKQILLTAYAGFHGEIWSTYSDVSGLVFGIIFGADFAAKDKISVGPTDAGFGKQQMSWKIFPHYDPSIMSDFSDSSPLTLAGCSKLKFCLFYITPVLTLKNHTIIILGELSKWVPVSPKRITSITIATEDIYVTMAGDEHEIVTITIQRGTTTQDVTCRIGATGAATLSVFRAQCL